MAEAAIPMEEIGFKRGDLIVQSKPFAFTLSYVRRGVYCDFCFEKTKLRRCSRCAYIQYCSKRCQKKAWPEHKLECHCMAHIKDIPADKLHQIDLFILCGRILLKSQSKKVPTDVAGAYTRTYDDLMSYGEQLLQDKKDMNYTCTNFSNYIQQDLTREEVAELFGKMYINSFGIFEVGSMLVLGRGLYLGASIFDHSCDPDAIWFFDGTTIQIRAIRQTATRDVKQIYVNYRGHMETQENRRYYLKKYFYFDCTCKICIDPDYKDKFEDVLQQKKSYKVIQRSIELNEKYIRHVSRERVYLYLLDEGVHCLKQQEGILPDHNIYRLSVLVLVMNIASACQRWKKAFAHGNLILEAYLKVYGYWHPTTVNHSFILAVIVLMNGRRDEYLGMLVQVIIAASVIYGYHHTFCKRLRDAVDICRDDTLPQEIFLSLTRETLQPLLPFEFGVPVLVPETR